MDAIEKLKYLNGELHIPFKVLAPYCKCHAASLSNYVKRKYEPTEKMLALIAGGLDDFVKEVAEKMKDDID